jgi:Fic family protein
MKLPMPAPEHEDLLRRELRADDVSTLRLIGFSGPDEYLHWDQLRHRTPPEGLTHEQWWLALSLRRRIQWRQVPLLQKSGTPFHIVLTDRMLAACEALTRRLGAPRFDAEGAVNRQTGSGHLVRSLVEEAITSSQLEGASTSRRVAKELLDSGREPHDRSEQMIVNNYEVMEWIRERAAQEMTPEAVLQVHRIVTDGTLDDPSDAGRLETPGRERVAVWDDGAEARRLHTPPPAEELEARLQALCDFANGATGGTYLPDIVRAVVVHFMVGYDHYFADGNGRTARALFYWSMLRSDHWLAEFVSISSVLRTAPSAYARAYLHTEDDDGDLTYFVHHQLEVLRRAADAFDRHLERKQAEQGEARTGLEQVAGDLNHRQRELLRGAVEDDGGRTVAVTPYARRFRVSDQTARNDLNDLAGQGMLLRERAGRRHVFRVPADLTERLKASKDG